MITNRSKRNAIHLPLPNKRRKLLYVAGEGEREGEEVRPPSFDRSKLIKPRVKATLHTPGDICNSK